jgi:hypothetical protein
MFIVEDLLLEIAAKTLFLYSNLCIIVKFDCLSCSYTSRLYPILQQADIDVNEHVKQSNITLRHKLNRLL